MTTDAIRILVIDDDAELASVVSDALQAHGYETLVANSGERGLELAFTGNPHLILLDVTMPGMDGHQVCRELQFGYTKDIPIVFLTAKTDLANMMKASHSGASGYITKPFRAERLLETVASVLRSASVFHDDITGLPTLAQTQLEVQRMLSERGQLGILYVSVDGVLGLEQTHGFEAVDTVFRVIGKRLTEARGEVLRDADVVAITSLGDAFLVVLSPARAQGYVDGADLLAIQRRLQARLLEHLREEIEELLVAKIGVYVGCARLTQSPKVRFRRALLGAIEQATRWVEREREVARHRLRDELELVVRNRQVTCVHQPIVRLEDFSVAGYELLTRGPLDSPLHQPDALFEVARVESLVSELDRVCRLEAARSSTSLPAHYLRFINTETEFLCSDRSNLLVREFVDAVPEELRSRTVIELTENSVIDDFARVREIVRRFRGEGFRIAIDDAGAGHSGLQTMVEVEPDFIKLDMSLTRGVESSVVKRKLVAKLSDFCRDAEIGLISEGIETSAQLDVLRQLDVGYGQGFLFAHPAQPGLNHVRIEPGASHVGARPEPLPDGSPSLASLGGHD